MGLFDSIMGSVMGSGQGGTQSALVNAVMQMIANKGDGGLSGLVQAFMQNGMGDIANSWVSRGQNLPISPDQIQNALGGSGLLAQLAQSAGLSQGEASSQLSQVLPGLVDKFTPDGQLPQQDTLQQMLDAFNIGK